MSKQSEAKEKQGYVAKPIPKVCGNCAHFKCDVTFKKWMEGRTDYRGIKYLDDPSYASPSNFRCGIGGFAVKKMGTCNEWAGKE